MILLSTVLSRRTGLKLSDQDLIVNVIGGIKVTEPAADLGIALAIVSSFKDLSPKESTIVIGEIGLSGELRRVQNITKRIDEAQKMGFSKAIIPNLQSKEIQNSEIKVIGVSNLKEAINIYFSNWEINDIWIASWPKLILSLYLFRVKLDDSLLNINILAYFSFVKKREIGVLPEWRNGSAADL